MRNLRPALGGIWHVKTYTSDGASISEPVQFNLGSGYLFAFTQGGMNAILLSIDYWTTNITIVNQTNNFTTNIGTFSKSANSKVVTFTPIGANKSLVWLYIGEIMA